MHVNNQHTEITLQGSRQTLGVLIRKVKRCRALKTVAKTIVYGGIGVMLAGLGVAIGGLATSNLPMVTSAMAPALMGLMVATMSQDLPKFSELFPEAAAKEAAIKWYETYQPAIKDKIAAGDVDDVRDIIQVTKDLASETGIDVLNKECLDMMLMHASRCRQADMFDAILLAVGPEKCRQIFDDIDPVQHYAQPWVLLSGAPQHGGEVGIVKSILRAAKSLDETPIMARCLAYHKDTKNVFDHPELRREVEILKNAIITMAQDAPAKRAAAAHQYYRPTLG